MVHQEAAEVVLLREAEVPPHEVPLEEHEAELAGAQVRRGGRGRPPVVVPEQLRGELGLSAHALPMASAG